MKVALHVGITGARLESLGENGFFNGRHLYVVLLVKGLVGHRLARVFGAIRRTVSLATAA